MTRPDLADRALFVNLGVIHENHRRDEIELWRAFERDRAKILGALLDAISVGLKRLPHMNPSRLPRMADFARWLMACETALWSAGTFERAYAANRASAVEETLEQDQTASAVRALMHDRDEWVGVTKTLLAKLTEVVGEHSAKSRGWPRTERALTSRLKQVATFLRRVGIIVSWAEHRTEHGRLITIRRHREVAVEPSVPSGRSASSKIASVLHDLDGVTVSNDAQPQPSGLGSTVRSGPHPEADRQGTIRPTVSEKPFKSNGNDGHDDHDGLSPTPSRAEFLRQEAQTALRGNPPALGPPGDSLDDFA